MSSAADEIKRRYKYLYHMAELGSWESIRSHGLLSTTALLDLFEVEGSLRLQLESQHRPQSKQIQHPKYGTAVIRDQKPMDDTGLQRALGDGLTPTDWYKLLNSKVFFWLTIDRLHRMLDAKAYREALHIVLTVDTSSLVDAHRDRIELCRMNSGCTKPFPHPRGIETFRRLDQYPENNWIRSEPVVELTVDYSVPDIRRHIIAAHEAGVGKPDRLVWKNGK